jgi:hypothetical protein
MRRSVCPPSIEKARMARNILDHRPLAVQIAPSAVCQLRGRSMNGLIYLVGLIVVILAILSFFGLR